ncbi:MAG: hypothetical protein RSD95_16895, partial [Clostridia bacterium]
AHILPHDRGANRVARFAIPNRHCFPLIRYGKRGNFGLGNVRKHLVDYRANVFENFACVLFRPSRRGIELMMWPLSAS